MQTIRASEFKAKCLALMASVSATGEVWVITKMDVPWRNCGPTVGDDRIPLSVYIEIYSYSAM
jgi:hypothetical protein